jgi:excinuclease ABC subunit B
MSRGKSPTPTGSSRNKTGRIEARTQGLARDELARLIGDLNNQMLAAAGELQFELAARIRDEMSELKKELRTMEAAL